MKAESTVLGNSPAPRLLTPLEAASLLNVSRSTLYRLVESRTLTFYRVRGSLRFAQEDLQAFLAGTRVESVLGKD